MTATLARSALRSRIREELGRARQRTLDLCNLPDADLIAQHSPIMSPMVWDLAHVANYEELWLLRALDGRPPVDELYDWMYNAFEHPRVQRPNLPLLGPAEARAYAREVRSAVLDLLEGSEGSDEDEGNCGSAPALLDDGFVYGMVIQHEHQHAETLLATRQLMGGRARRPPGARPGEPSGPEIGLDGPVEVLLPGGRFVMGTTSDPWAYDNERPAHELELRPFWIDRVPVTNAEFSRFIEAGGYEQPEWWTPEGWEWRKQQDLPHPLFWSAPAGAPARVLRFGRWIELSPLEPVQHVCWYEADAYARWRGCRLPTEAEWEYAATWHPDGRKQRYPWGDEAPSPAHANLGQRWAGPRPAAGLGPGANPWGVLQLIGDVWEWTSSDFEAYPGFQAFPYREYSEVFFPAGGNGTYKVLRGGSWATDPIAVRGTFRNWDLPMRRQIFCGFRCARDA